MFKILLISSFISLTIIGCSVTEQSAREFDITGNWFFIDRELDSMFFYNEVYIDSTNLHYSLGNTGLIPAFEYRIINDTIYVASEPEPTRPFFIIRERKTDTLTIEMLPSQVTKSSKLLTYIRLNSHEKGILDYDKNLLQNSDSIYNLYAADKWRRFEEYLIAIGETTREQLDAEKADSSNYIIIPQPEITENN